MGTLACAAVPAVLHPSCPLDPAIIMIIIIIEQSILMLLRVVQNGDGRANVVDILGVLGWFGCIVGENEPAPPPPPSPCQDVECGANSTCVVDEVDYLCNCDEGYSQVDDQCLPSFPCDTDETHTCDYARATCNHEEAGRFSCTCTSGFEGDGLRDGSGCEDINPRVAETGPCADGVECTDVPAPDDGFACGDCPSGSTALAHPPEMAPLVRTLRTALTLRVARTGQVSTLARTRTPATAMPITRLSTAPVRRSTPVARRS